MVTNKELDKALDTVLLNTTVRARARASTLFREQERVSVEDNLRRQLTGMFLKYLSDHADTPTFKEQKDCPVMEAELSMVIVSPEKLRHLLLSALRSTLRHHGVEVES